MSRNLEQACIEQLERIYGPSTQRNWEDFKKKYPLYTPFQLLQAYKEEPTSLQTYLLRESNLLAVTELVISEQAKHWKILSAGCGKGPEPYEIVLRTLAQGSENFRISAFDVSPEVIAEAREGKLKEYLRIVRTQFCNKMVKENLLQASDEYLERGDMYVDYVVPKKVKSFIEFSTHDIIDGPFVPASNNLFDIVVCNNVILHYPLETKIHILNNLLKSLKQGGYLIRGRDTYEGVTMPLFESRDWESHQRKVGLVREDVVIPLYNHIVRLQRYFP